MAGLTARARRSPDVAHAPRHRAGGGGAADILRPSMASPERDPQEAPPASTAVVRLMFLPLRFASRRAAPRLSRRLFERLWAALDGGRKPPRAELPERSLAVLATALVLEGACERLVGGLLDRETRRRFARWTGRWPAARRTPRPEAPPPAGE